MGAYSQPYSLAIHALRVNEEELVSLTLCNLWSKVQTSPQLLFFLQVLQVLVHALIPLVFIISCLQFDASSHHVALTVFEFHQEALLF